MYLCHARGKHHWLDPMESHHIGVASAAALFCGGRDPQPPAGCKHPLHQLVIIIHTEAHIICGKVDIQGCAQLLAGLLQALLHMGSLGV